MAGNPIYNTKQWKEVRRLVLEEDGECHWCRLHGKRTKATQVDHIIELDRGGDPYDRSNLVPSCASCNSSRGATFVNNKTTQRIQARNKASQNVSFLSKSHTDRKSVV
jgi:5-methylcytosine-specific restriction endonuclease McrA